MGILSALKFIVSTGLNYIIFGLHIVFNNVYEELESPPKQYLMYVGIELLFQVRQADASSSLPVVVTKELHLEGSQS